MNGVGFIHISKVAPLNGEIRHTSILPCACGGRVRADRRFPTEGVRSHQRTKQHQAWREAQERE